MWVVHIVITDQGISFRSRGNNCIDVSEIAKLYGGGGHPQAAGCAINKEAQLSYVKAILNFNSSINIIIEYSIKAGEYSPAFFSVIYQINKLKRRFKIWSTQ